MLECSGPAVVGLLGASGDSVLGIIVFLHWHLGVWAWEDCNSIVYDSLSLLAGRLFLGFCFLSVVAVCCLVGNSSGVWPLRAPGKCVWLLGAEA